MTKRKTGVFKGGWMDPTVPYVTLKEIIEREPSSINIDPVIEVVARQREIYIFEKQRMDTEPQVAEWRDLVLAISIPETVDDFALFDLKKGISDLPLKVKSVLTHLVFERKSKHWNTLIEEMLHSHIDISTVEVFRDVLADIAESLKYVSGKRGPKWDCAPALNAVIDAILVNSKLKKSQAMYLAADLLNACGMKSPTSKSGLSEKLGGGNSRTK